MSNAVIVKKDSFSLEPTTLEEAMKYADIIAKSSVVPKHYQGKPGDILVAVQMGAEVGLKPIQALQNIAVINGKPSIYGDACLALVKAHKEFEDIKEYYDDATETAICEIKRKSQSWHKTTFSRKDAEKANLWGKTGPWTQYTKRMQQMRARGFNVRDTFPDALQGLILREEAEDYPMQNVTHTEPRDNESLDIQAPANFNDNYKLIDYTDGSQMTLTKENVYDYVNGLIMGLKTIEDIDVYGKWKNSNKKEILRYAKLNNGDAAELSRRFDLTSKRINSELKEPEIEQTEGEQ